MEPTLAQICAVYRTDKNDLHCYVDRVYEDLFRDVRHTTSRLLEIGVESGGSLCMWSEYFPNATVTGVDLKPCPQVGHRGRIEVVVGNAYDHATADGIPGGFDIVIDDGPHTLESMTFVLLEYLGKVRSGGVLVIEDIPDFNWTNILRRLLPSGHTSEVRDLRRVRGRNDDILMIVRPD